MVGGVKGLRTKSRIIAYELGFYDVELNVPVALYKTQYDQLFVEYDEARLDVVP